MIPGVSSGSGHSSVDVAGAEITRSVVGVDMLLNHKTRERRVKNLQVAACKLTGRAGPNMGDLFAMQNS
jgi:hypothetical protein